ncbi:MAG: alpha/beta fold hydrolase [Bacteroidota bacterium]
MTKFLILLLLSTLGFSQTEAIITSGNSKLHYKTFGKGKPILIINGGPGMNCEGFAFIAQELAKMNFKTIIYDQRGTGKSTLEKVNSETLTMDLMVEDIENLRHHLKIDKWTVFGQSFGGMMATYYASKHPETIEKLIFSASGGVNLNFTTYSHQRMYANLTKTQKDSLDYYQDKVDNGDSSMETMKLRAKYLANAYVYDKSNAPIIAQRFTQVKFEINRLVFDNLRKINYDCSKSFSNFKPKVIVLQGKNDIISIDTAQEVANAFPNSKLVLMENCGHYGWLDAKDIYFKSINDFLNN